MVFGFPSSCYWKKNVRELSTGKVCLYFLPQNPTSEICLRTYKVIQTSALKMKWNCLWKRKSQLWGCIVLGTFPGGSQREILYRAAWKSLHDTHTHANNIFKIFIYYMTLYKTIISIKVWLFSLYKDLLILMKKTMQKVFL